MSAIRQKNGRQELELTIEEPLEIERRRIGRYRLCFQLAAGGMATVYLARVEGPSGFGKLVALKRIHPHLAGESAYVDMFLDEARIASRITHANVCSVFDFGEVEGEYYIAMEYLVGETLSRTVRHLAKEKRRAKSPAYPSFCARTIADVCEGLHAAHEIKDAHGEPLNVVHRDISPQNIFVSYDGVVRIVDFGIASARDKLYQTSTGEVKGKFAYMSPEQLRESERVDRRTDVWALGVVLWEMLTMRRLFRRNTQPETMYAVLEADVPAPSAVRAGVPAALDAIVLKALAREPDDRYQSARAMGRALVEFVSSTDHPMGLADVSEWMGELFPGGEARTRQIMDIARLPTGGVPALPRHSTEIPAAESVSSIRTVTETPEPLFARMRARRRRRWLAGALLLLGALGGAAAAFWGAFDPPTEEAEVAANDTAAAAPTAAHADPAEADEREAALPRGSDLPPSNLDEAEAAGEPPEEPAPIEPDSETVEEAPAPRRRRVRGRGGRAAPAVAQPSTPGSTPAAAERAMGTVSVIVRGGWANVYDGDQFLGATPLRVELTAGPHRLQLRPFGQPPPAYRNVTVPSGGRTRVVFTIDPE